MENECKLCIKKPLYMQNQLDRLREVKTLKKVTEIKN